ncbi:Inosine triphosphate pyrophosphatase [Zea mays]|uniref:Inosine triphosphate pyrophosphatase n=1 Tax=Zea mays TaxID=4577 RepID=A0A1D6ESI3_MAIZE|nr:Inosine triphosphate pyrophosphatase [Zea mays]
MKINQRSLCASSLLPLDLERNQSHLLAKLRERSCLLEALTILGGILCSSQMVLNKHMLRCPSQ